MKKKEKAQLTGGLAGELFVEDKDIWGRFLRMLWKAKLPLLWIAGYFVLDMIIVNIGVTATEYTSEMFAGNLSFRGVILPFIIYSGVNLITTAITTFASYAVRARIDRNLRRMVWDKITRLPMRYFDRVKPKEMLTRITDDTSTISSLIMLTLVPAVTGIYSLYVVFQKVGSYDAGLMWSLLLVVPFVVGSGLAMGKLKFGVNDDVNRKYAEMGREMSEKLTNRVLIKATANEEKEEAKGNTTFKNYYESSIRSNWIGSLTSPLATMVGCLQLVVVVLVGRSFYQSGAISLAQWIAYLAFAQQAANSLQAYSGYWQSFKASQGATRRVTYIMDEMDEVVGKGEAADEMQGAFEFKNVSFSYGENKVLNGIDLVIPEGKVTALVGMSGGGKTTLLNLLERFYEPEEGEITVGGKNLADYELQSYRHQIAYITQESTMLSGSIRDNLLFGVNREVTDEELDQACRAAYAIDFIKSFPEGYETNVGENGSRLSGGQKQRIAIARALLQNPRYMFLDEATAAMDAKAKQEVWAGLESLLSGNRTAVMVAHDYQTASHADYVVVVAYGKVMDAGTQKEMYERNDFFRQFVDAEEG